MKHGPHYEGTRASSLSRVCVIDGQETVPDYPCFSEEHEHKPNPKWLITEDGYKFDVGDRLFNYYDCVWGTVISEPDSFNGWFSFQQDKGTTSLNSVRVSKYQPEWLKK